jgi:hypothetical protein
VTRVVGLGAEDCGDDTAGLLVARLVRAAAPPGVEVLECAGDAGVQLESLDGADRVIVVDAARGRRQSLVRRGGHVGRERHQQVERLRPAVRVPDELPIDALDNLRPSTGDIAPLELTRDELVQPPR